MTICKLLFLLRLSLVISENILVFTFISEDVNQSEWITLNVGGKIYTTTRFGLILHAGAVHANCHILSAFVQGKSKGDT